MAWLSLLDERLQQFYFCSMGTNHEFARITNGRLVRKDIVLPDLSYRIVGVLFEVYNTIGFGHLERVYQDAVAHALNAADIKFVEQPVIELKYKNAQVGRYIPDFIVEDSLILELKQGVNFNRIIFNQVNAYLKASGYSLAIIANFNQEGLFYRRFVNIY